MVIGATKFVSGLHNRSYFVECEGSGATQKSDRGINPNIQALSIRSRVKIVMAVPMQIPGAVLTIAPNFKSIVTQNDSVFLLPRNCVQLAIVTTRSFKQINGLLIAMISKY